MLAWTGTRPTPCWRAMVGQEAINKASEQARRFRVESVPIFIIDGKFTLGGAQPLEAFFEGFRQAVDLR
jgi:predicted DsbA family dithiol-disulfide isomerase